MRFLVGIGVALVLSHHPAVAGEPESTDAPTTEVTPPIEDEAAKQSREAFLHGVELVKATKWSEALAAFERSSAVRKHAVTTFNMGACLRALGRYVLARQRFREALALDDAASRTQLSEALRSDIEALLIEIDKTLVRARVTLQPASAAIAIDGRPLERWRGDDKQRRPDGKRPLMLAGTRSGGSGERAPAARFEVLLDPGPHVIALSRKGYRDTVVKKTWEPGTTTDLDLTIARLPARVVIDAQPKDAAVMVNGRDAGVTPLELERRAGTYNVLVQKEGYVPYEQTVTLAPGQQVKIRARLPVEPPALYERWWFWTSIIGAAASVAVTTFVVTYREPEREPPNAGGLGWVIELP